MASLSRIASQRPKVKDRTRLGKAGGVIAPMLSLERMISRNRHCIGAERLAPFVNIVRTVSAYGLSSLLAPR
jgi:hypothetical protein